MHAWFTVLFCTLTIIMLDTWTFHSLSTLNTHQLCVHNNQSTLTQTPQGQSCQVLLEQLAASVSAETADQTIWWGLSKMMVWLWVWTLPWILCLPSPSLSPSACHPSPVVQHLSSTVSLTLLCGGFHSGISEKESCPWCTPCSWFFWVTSAFSSFPFLHSTADPATSLGLPPLYPCPLFGFCPKIMQSKSLVTAIQFFNFV